MARIPLIGGFTLIPEGTHVFKIEKVDYDEDFGKMLIHMITQDEQKHTEKFHLKNADDSYNEKALAAFSFFAKTALGEYDRDDIDPEELVGHFIEAEVIHNKVPSKKDPNKTVTFVNLGDKAPSDGWDKKINLDDLLG